MCIHTGPRSNPANFQFTEGVVLRQVSNMVVQMYKFSAKSMLRCRVSSIVILIHKVGYYDLLRENQCQAIKGVRDSRHGCGMVALIFVFRHVAIYQHV